MSQRAKDLATSNAPWRRDVKWPIVVAEGAALLLIGVLTLVATDTARGSLYALLALLLSATGAATAARVIRRPPDPNTGFQALRAGASIMTGVLALLNWLTTTFDADDSRLILGVGYLVSALISLAALIMLRKHTGFRPSSLIGPLIAGAIGVMLITGSASDDGRATFMGWSMVVLGAALVGLGLMQRQQSRPKPAPQPA